MTRWWLRALVSSIVAAVLLTFVPLDEVWQAIRRVNPWVWGLSVFVFAGGHALNALKLWLLLGGAAPAGQCLRAHFAGMASNLGFPGVVGGEVVRAAWLVPGAGAARVTIAAVADRLIDTCVLLLLAGTAAAVAGLPPAISEPARTGGRWLAMVALLVAAAAFVFSRRLGRTSAWPRLREGWEGLLCRPGLVGLAFGTGLAVQTTFVLVTVWLAAEVGLRMAIAPWFLAWTAAKLSALLPISLGGLGVREAALVTVLAAYGAPAEAVLATGILWDGVLVAGSLGGLLVTQVALARPSQG